MERLNLTEAGREAKRIYQREKARQRRQAQPAKRVPTDIKRARNEAYWNKLGLRLEAERAAQQQRKEGETK